MKIELIVLLMTCHWMADFTHLSTNWMLSAKRIGKPLFPILCHALVHGALMYSAMYLYFRCHKLEFIYAILFQVLTHFVIDTLKGKLNVWFPSLSNPANKFHWWVFGLDQLAHYYVILAMSKYLL